MTATAIRPETLATVQCPSWCESPAEHLDESFLEDITHVGPAVAPLAVGTADGEPEKVLCADIRSHTRADGSPCAPYVWLRPSDAYAEGEEMNAAYLRDFVRRLRQHADALASLAAQLAEVEYQHRR